jgi:soluble lytic murein transglycosylase-like protein
MKPLRRHAQALAACIAAVLGSSAQAATRYQCLMLDGTTRMSVQDLSARFNAAVQNCRLVETPESARAEPALLYEGGRLPGLSDSIARFAAPMLLSRPAGPIAPMPEELQRLVNAASQRRGLDPKLVSALVHVESRYQVQARSPKGALGLMQIMPATGARYGVGSGRDLLDPAVNIDIGTRYLRDLHEMFDGRTDLVLAAYNAGEGAVRRYGNRIPPYPETQDYVQKIMGMYRGR